MTELTEDDYTFDPTRLLAGIGQDPRFVQADTIRIAHIDGKLAIEYTVLRAIPPRILGMGILAGAPTPAPEAGDQDEPDG